MTRAQPQGGLGRSARIMWGVYKQYWRINLLTTLEYRENFVLWFGFTFVYHASSVAALWIVLNEFPVMNGWTFPDMFFLYAMWMVAHALHNTFFSTVGSIPDHIRDGEFDRLLVRPLDALFQAIATPGQIFPDELILALLVFALASWLSGVQVGPLFVVAVPFIWVGGALIDLAFNLFISTVAFWFVRVDALRWIVLQLEQEFTRYPISIYSQAVRRVMTFVIPFAFMNFYPARFFLHKAGPASWIPELVGLLTPAIGVLFVALAYGFWRLGLNKYSGVGH